MSSIALENEDIVIEKTKTKEQLKKELIRKNDIKFINQVAIMAMANVMLIAWKPEIEVPIVIAQIIFNIIYSRHIKKFKEENNMQEEN